jgi:hypothetical protein
MHSTKPDADDGLEEDANPAQQQVQADMPTGVESSEQGKRLIEKASEAATLEEVQSDTETAMHHETEELDDEDMLAWWMHRLAALQLSESQSDITVTVNPITNISGKASIDRSGKPTRCLFDITFSLDFDMEMEEMTSSGIKMFTSSTGTVRVKKFTHDTRSDIEVELDGTDIAQPVAESHVLPRLKRGLKECVAVYEALVCSS